MNIGFDAKRAFHNATGLGVFSRTLINLLATHYPSNHYYLFNPKKGNLYHPGFPQVSEILPQQPVHRMLSSLWRSKWVTGDLQKHKISLYHGLSHEIPRGISKTGIPSVVTMHDMFPELYPGNYKSHDVKIYRAKSRYACRHATRIMAISQETKKHIVELYGTDPARIEVMYQSFDPIFSEEISEENREQVRKKLRLPDRYFLHVGSIIPRKNLLNICRALQIIRNDVPLPLVVVGNGGAFKNTVKQFLAEQQMEDRVIFMADAAATVERGDLPAVFSMATAMIYPSYYEGFGIPLAEAMASGTPVITANTSCLPEVTGPAAFYTDPSSAEQMAEGLKKIYDDKAYAENLTRLGKEQVKQFAPENYVKKVMEMYQSVLAGA